MSETAISVLIKRASLEFDKTANNYLSPYGLTNSQFKILKHLYRQPDLSVTQRDLEIYFSMTNPTVTGILQNLEKKELIFRQPNPKDARSKLIGLTEKAQDLQEQMMSLGHEMDALLTKNLTEEQKNDLLGLLQIMLSH